MVLSGFFVSRRETLRSVFSPRGKEDYKGRHSGQKNKEVPDHNSRLCFNAV